MDNSKYLLGAGVTSTCAMVVLLLDREHVSWMSHAFAAKFGVIAGPK